MKNRINQCCMKIIKIFAKPVILQYQFEISTEFLTCLQFISIYITIIINSLYCYLIGWIRLFFSPALCLPLVQAICALDLTRKKKQKKNLNLKNVVKWYCLYAFHHLDFHLGLSFSFLTNLQHPCCLFLNNSKLGNSIKRELLTRSKTMGNEKL